MRAFFGDDFESIPHSRPFELWAKDVLFYPLAPINYYYDFDNIVKDLSGLDPKYFSSWPSYRHFNDLKWHKYIPDDSEEITKAIIGYNLRRPSFLLGAVKGQKESMGFALENYGTFDMKYINDIYSATHKELRLGQEGQIFKAVQNAANFSRGNISSILYCLEYLPFFTQA